MPHTDRMERTVPTRLAVIGAVVLLMTTGCGLTSTVDTASGPARTSARGPVADTAGGRAGSDVRVAVVGDSLTAGGGRLLSDGLTDDTWMTYAQGDGVVYAGGWAKGGSTVQEQAAAVTPVADVDVLVLMSGTNDVRLGLDFAASAASYDAIVDTIRAEHVVVAAIPPFDRAPEAAARYESQLESYVVEKGWTFTDPWGFARAGDVFSPGTSRDGIHPTTAGYERLGHELRRTILEVSGTTVSAARVSRAPLASGGRAEGD